MGTLMDLNKKSTHDYVDNPYWSVFQVRVKYLLHNVYINNHLEQLQKTEEQRIRSEEDIKAEELETKDLKEDEKKDHFLTRLLSRGAFIGDTDKSKVSNNTSFY